MMRWQTPKGTIELAPLQPAAEEHAVQVSELLKDAMTHFTANRLQEAGALCQSILRILPDHTDTLHLYGVTYHQAGQHLRAIELLNKAIKLNPNEPKYLNDIGEAYRALDRIKSALQSYDRALALRPDFIEANNNKGVALYTIGHLEEAVSYFEKVLAINPDYILAINNLGAVLHDLGRNDDSINQYKKALALQPESAESHHHIAVICKPKPEDKETIAIQKMLDKPDLKDEDIMHLNFALGRIYDNAREYNKAMEYYNNGNLYKRKTIDFNISSYISYVDDLHNIYTTDYFKRVKHLANDSDRPIFIIGMPRSGTTLVEQIISSHPEVHGAGELPCFEHTEQLISSYLGSNLRYPLCMPALTPTIAQDLARQYLEHLDTYSADNRHVTDKMPGNYQRIGLIKTLFPNARIIHCLRNPMDTCVSIYCNYFRGTHNYAYDLQELGLFYRQYERLMAHWRRLFGAELHEVQYEELTRNQEKLSRELIAYLGLDWDDRCLEFYNNKRPVQTASKMQVVQPMYTTSVNKWKRYEKYLGPLIEILGNNQV
jgi:tetratricopeptide (TPR) repeat protein